MGAGALAPGRVCTEFPKDKEFRAFEMLEKIELSSKPRRCADCAALPKTELRPPTNSRPAPGPVLAGGACCGRTRLAGGGGLCKKKNFEASKFRIESNPNSLSRLSPLALLRLQQRLLNYWRQTCILRLNGLAV